MADPAENPYYLHASDHPGLVLVSTPLTDENYASWKRSMVLALSGKNKLGFVDGTIPQPPLDDPLHRSWNRNSNIVACWLINSISKEIAASVIYSTTATAIWIDLQTRFEQRNGPRVFQIRKNAVHARKLNSE